MKNTNQKPKYVEEVLQQKEFEVEDVLNAKLKYPLVFWIKLNWFSFADAVDMKYAVIKGRTKRLLRKFGLLNK